MNDGTSFVPHEPLPLRAIGVEAILGLRTVAGELRVDPCIPAAWPGFEAWVSRGDVRLHIVVKNAARGGGTVVTVDGVETESNAVPLTPGEAGVREVLVLLGSASTSAAATSPHGPAAGAGASAVVVEHG